MGYFSDLDIERQEMEADYYYNVWLEELKEKFAIEDETCYNISVATVNNNREDLDYGD